jgi:DNA-binding winged helix-turn-helix (wHTH) protein
MRLLLCLAEHAGEVVSIDDLLNQVWSEVVVAPDSVYQAVASLRRLLGDDPKKPIYIATVPRLGYRMVATVSPWADQSRAQTGAQTNPQTGSSDSEPLETGDHRYANAQSAAQSRLHVGRQRGPWPGPRRCFPASRQGREQQSRSLNRRCSAATEIHRRAAVSRPDRRDAPGGIRRRHDRGTD